MEIGLSSAPDERWPSWVTAGANIVTLRSLSTGLQSWHVVAVAHSRRTLYVIRFNDYIAMMRRGDRVTGWDRSLTACEIDWCADLGSITGKAHELLMMMK